MKNETKTIQFFFQSDQGMGKIWFSKLFIVDKKGKNDANSLNIFLDQCSFLCTKRLSLHNASDGKSALLETAPSKSQFSASLKAILTLLLG